MSDEVRKEIDSMLKVLGEDVPPPKEEEEEETEEETEEEETKGEETEEKEEEEEEKPEEKEEEEKEEETEEEEEEAKSDEAKEKEALDQIEKERTERKNTEEIAEKSRKDEEERRKKDDEPLKLDEQDFIGDLDLDDLTRDKTAFNKILNAVYTKGVNDSRKLASEGVLRSIPDIVRNNIEIVSSLKRASEDFYTTNKDLVPFKKVVATVFEEVASSNPGKSYSDLMKLTAPEARNRLGLKTQALKEERPFNNERKPPKLPGKKAGVRPFGQKPNLTPMQKEIDSMNSVLGG